MSDDKLTRAQSADLQKLTRMIARNARDGIEAFKAQRLLAFERELQERYEVDNAAWAELTAEAEATVGRIDAEIAERCKALGIRPEFRPRISASWYRAGENGSKERQAELRKLARLELDAMGKAAKDALIFSL